MEKESPIDYQMDTDTNTTTTDNLSISSASPTISNKAVNGSFLISSVKMNNELVDNMNSIKLTTENENRNTLSLDTTSNSENYQSSFRKLTPVHHHPLMLNDSFEEEIDGSLKMSNATRNFPDVVLTHSTAEASKISLATADIVNSVNNNNSGAKKIIHAKPFYREPSPVSISLIFLIILRF